MIIRKKYSYQIIITWITGVALSCQIKEGGARHNSTSVMWKLDKVYLKIWDQLK